MATGKKAAAAGVWNARVLLRKIRKQGYTRRMDWLRVQRMATQVVVRRFETPARKQAQVDWGHLGSIEV